jgi:acetolactate synthase-1/3 small subunit
VAPHRHGLEEQTTTFENTCLFAQVTDLSPVPFVSRELMLIKVSCGAEQRRQLSDLAEIFRGTVCDVSPTTLTLEMQGKEDKMFALQKLLQPYGEPYVAYTLF